MAFGFLSAIRNRHFHSLMGNVVMAFFNVLSFSLLVRLLSLNAFGEWVTFIGTYNLLDQIRTALLQTGLIKFYAGVDETTGRRVIGAGWYISILLTLSYITLSFLAYFVAYRWFNPTWHLFICWLGMLTLFSLPMNFATWVLQAEHRFEKIIWIRLMQNGSFLVLLGVLYLTKLVSLPNVLYTYCASMALASIYCLLRKWTMIRSVFFRTKEQARELFNFGKHIVGSMASSSLLNYSDTLVIRTLLNPAAVAIYSIPQKFMEVIEIILRSFVATAQPTLSGAANRNDYTGVARAFAKYTGTVSLLITPFIIGLLIFTQPLIIILAKSTYLDATDIVRIILFSAILWPIDRFIGVTLDMINLPNVNFYKNFLKLILNVACDILFVWIYTDIRSVAFASLLNVIFAVVFGYYFLKKHLDVHLRDVWTLGWQECKRLLAKVTGKAMVADKA
ncbi:MAG TPA: oligosaccharide flippase family protein [Chitinophaga sp.]|uniref:oligosaccharide flippase family protein n=1 Tax=Chitinophaga sp. TaxID=1869181 RepID=UPI002F93F840